MNPYGFEPVWKFNEETDNLVDMVRGAYSSLGEPRVNEYRTQFNVLDDAYIGLVKRLNTEIRLKEMIVEDDGKDTRLIMFSYNKYLQRTYESRS